MNRYLRILGNGQIWDVRGIDSLNSLKTFEDLFSGRALGEMARQIKIFSRFKERGRVTGFSVTKALLSNNPTAKKQAKIILDKLAGNGALGIEALTRGKGFKNNWRAKEKNYWKNIDIVVVGGGVSEGLTGELLIDTIKKQLSKRALSKIQIYQAKFPGKEAGILGSIINIIGSIAKEAKKKGFRQTAGIAIDIGRDDIGVGLLAIDTGREEILKQEKDYWLFRSSVKTPDKKYLKKFLDARDDYSKAEFKLGIRIRDGILSRIADLVVKAEAYAKKKGFVTSKEIAVAVPGSAGKDGAILDSTDYLPFFRKKDGFIFARALEEILRKKTLQGYRVYIINDGIAAGIANMHFDFLKERNKKIAFLGVGSGLGGCVGMVK